MKDGDSTAVGRAPAAPEPEGFANRKLIRPSLGRSEHTRATEQMMERRERTERPERTGGGAASGKKSPPPEQTHAENFYYQKQMQAKTPMVIVLQDGEEIHGIIEWYDKTCIKVNRVGEPNLLIYKPAVKYMYKEAEERR
jgi:sRNA-binding regulator protein Hfq